ncbi:acyltransferase [Pseudoleptotrichia goodfellowii]|uniref:Acyltransferase n=2 Tax=Pseudoleptotrichia goodfellowii TaxID=157692 RepID=A0A510J7H4_9FUSO|nr:acyltransferase family protein [Pseudoleptotrichia goodfellowii]BBM35168.1 acyltransferase [Pseudoleptotrichia goodfellowii]
MKKNRRIEEIDVLRAAALIMICLYHWFTYKGMYVGVIIFFALSGYLFTSSLLSRDFSCFNVIKRRMSKIYPALLTVILVSTIVLIIMNGGLEEKYKNSAFFSVIGLNNIHQIISGISYFDSYNIILPLTHIWALSFQIQMYVFFPFILKGLKKFKLKDELIGIIFFGISVLSALLMGYKYYKGADISRIYYGTDTRAFTFFVGAAVAMFYNKREISKESEKIKVLLAGMSGIFLSVIFALTVDYKNPLGYYGLLYFISVLSAFSAVLFTKIKLRKLQIPFLSGMKKVLSLLGRREYHYYLWQYPLMIFMREIFKWSKVGFLSQFILEILILIVISEISYFIFEKKNLKVPNYAMPGIIIMLLLFAPLYKNKDLEEMKTVQAQIKEETVKEIEKETVTETEEKTEKTDEKKEEKKSEEEKQKTENIDDRNILFIGDSVLEMTKPELEKKYPNAIIDVKIGRQFSELAGLLTEFKNSGKLGKTVVIALGTNGPILDEDAKKAMAILEGHDVYFVNSVVARPWEKRVNREIANIAKNYGNVKIIDWYSYAKGEKEYFYKDGVHPKPAAAKKYVNLVYSAVSKNK